MYKYTVIECMLPPSLQGHRNWDLSGIAVCRNDVGCGCFGLANKLPEMIKNTRCVFVSYGLLNVSTIATCKFVWKSTTDAFKHVPDLFRKGFCIKVETGTQHKWSNTKSDLKLDHIKQGK